ncbi:MAG: TRAP transporter small permease [Candidatus Atribacteria bacterium]|nr:TRAP transporter small permease [Candidatus Atribacteria bacterium]
MRKLLDIVNKVLQSISVVSIGAMLVIIFIQVIFRYVFQHSLTFSEELARYLFVYTVFFGTAVVSKNNGHIIMEALTDHLKGKLAKYTKIFAYCCTIIFIFILFYYGIRMMVISSYQLSPALRISMSYVYLAIPVSAFVMLCNLLILIYDTLKEKG